MDSLVSTFHLNLSLLFAQAVNFLLVFLVLYYFALKPLLAVMRKRTEKIEQSLKQAEEIEKKLAQADQEYEAKINEAKKQAKNILAKAQKQAEENRRQILAKAKAEVGEIINKEKEKLKIEKAKILKEIKKEVSDLIVLAVEKILERRLDKPEDERLIKKIIKAANK